MNGVAKVARVITWGVFLLVSLITAGLSLAPEDERHIAGMFQAALFFSGVPVVAAAEFHIQRFELRQGATPGSLVLVLGALLMSYLAISVMAAHSEPTMGWGLLLSWLFVFVGLGSLRPSAHLERRLLLGSAGFISLGAALLLLLGLWLWPEFYYGYLMQRGHLEWTPYFMSLLGFVFWVALLAFNVRVKRAA
ncbi:hypothetical protein [Sphaerotilus uruguayifluvii]|uniref:DUF998 domain-containing protein n=1 Tax=Sphaerotilus uruguayifluvii TaxID=2735897 RepID=A0ABX2G630_9BURK|nr:hypothetical protein [Leptothrix sp. C29]NRT57201.1 hypothetical protein [Leptothrix sp. C29]